MTVLLAVLVQHPKHHTWIHTGFNCWGAILPYLSMGANQGVQEREGIISKCYFHKHCINMNLSLIQICPFSRIGLSN